jgi:hypothetical protein
MDRSLDLATGIRAAGLALKVRRATKLNQVACGVFHHFLALDDVSVLQAHFPTGLEAGRTSAEETSAKSSRSIYSSREKGIFLRASRFVLGIVHRIQLFDWPSDNSRTTTLMGRNTARRRNARLLRSSRIA